VINARAMPAPGIRPVCRPPYPLVGGDREWTADADKATLAALGRPGWCRIWVTFRRTLQNLDADTVDAQAGAWAQARTTLEPGGRRRLPQ
jgi:hypothetical protein